MAAHFDPFSPSSVTIENIRAAHRRVEPHIHRTPVLTCSALSAQAEKSVGIRLGHVFLKCENLQKIGAFKVRGALNAIGGSTKDVIVTHSSGNHAQAVALACRTLGKKAIIVMPKVTITSRLPAREGERRARRGGIGSTGREISGPNRSRKKRVQGGSLPPCDGSWSTTEISFVFLPLPFTAAIATTHTGC